MIRVFRPLGLAFAAALAGLLLALRFAPPALPLVAVAVVAASLGAWRAAAGREERADLVLLSAAMVLAGAALGASGARAAQLDCRAWIPDGERVAITARLGGGTAAGSDAPGALLPLVDAEIRSSGGHCAGSLRARFPDDAPAASAGSELRLAGEWVRSRPVAGSAWPRNPRFAGIAVIDSVLEARPVDPLRHPLLALRGRTEGVLRELYPTQSALTEALVLGRRERVDPDLIERFTRSGLVHLLAISGTHVGLFAAMLLLVGTVLRLPRGRVAWMSMGVVALYLAVIGAPPSAVRAGIMLSLALLAVVLQRTAAAIPVMAAAALAIVALDPLAVLNPGFQLSFAGVTGILVARRLVLDSIPGSWKRRPAARYLVEAFTISGAAFVFTAPIVAHHFGRMAPVAILANLPAIPVMALALSGVMISLSLYPLVPPLARLVADGASGALELLDSIAGIAAGLPYSSLPVARPDWLAWAVAALAAGAVWAWSARVRPRLRLALGAAAALALFVAWPAFAGAAGERLEIHFLDVGQGDAIAIRTPADRWVLIDAGGRGASYDAGERRVLPFLHARGARGLTALVITHPDADHVGGAAAIIRSLPVTMVIEPGLPVAKGLYAELLEEVERREIRWAAARAGRSVEIDGVTLDFLWPDSTLLDPRVDANEISAVVRLEYGGFAAMLPGDLPAEFEHELVRRHGAALRAQVLKVPHHGSYTSSSEEFLAAVDPELAVISVGRRNRYGHPAPEVLQRLAGRGIRIARTDREGTITVQATPQAAGNWVRRRP